MHMLVVQVDEHPPAVSTKTQLAWLIMHRNGGVGGMNSTHEDVSSKPQPDLLEGKSLADSDLEETGGTGGGGGNFGDQSL